MQSEATLKKHRWIALMGLCLINFTIGCLHCMGNIVMYSFSFMRASGNESIRYKSAGALYAVSMLGQTVVSGWIYELERFLGLQSAICVGALIASFGVLISYFTVHSFYGFLVTYGILSGLGYGLCFSTSMALAVKWGAQQPRPIGNPPAMLGLLCAMRGLAILVCSPLQTYFLNPLNLAADYAPYDNSPLEMYYTDETILSKVPYMFLNEGAILMVMQAVAFVMISKTVPQPDEKQKEQVVPVRLKDQPLTKFQILNDQNFWIVWFIMFFHYITSAFFQVYWKILSSRVIPMDKLLSYAGGSIGVTNVFGRLLYSLISEKFGNGVSGVAVLGLYSVLILSAKFLSGDNIPLCLACVGLISFLQGCTLSFFPILGTSLFGSDNFGTIFSYLYTSRLASAHAMALLYWMLAERLGTSYILVVLGCCSCISVLLSLKVCKQMPQSHASLRDWKEKMSE